MLFFQRLLMTYIKKGQSNLAKAASNALHTLQAQDSVVLAVREECRQSQNLKMGYVTALRTPEFTLRSFG